MEVKMADNTKLAVSGAIAGGITPFLLKWVVVPILNFLGGFVPQANLKLADTAVTVSVRESLQGFESIGNIHQSRNSFP